MEGLGDWVLCSIAFGLVLKQKNNNNNFRYIKFVPGILFLFFLVVRIFDGLNTGEFKIFVEERGKKNNKFSLASTAPLPLHESTPRRRACCVSGDQLWFEGPPCLWSGSFTFLLNIADFGFSIEFWVQVTGESVSIFFAKLFPNFYLSLLDYFCMSFTFTFTCAEIEKGLPAWLYWINFRNFVQEENIVKFPCQIFTAIEACLFGSGYLMYKNINKQSIGVDQNIWLQSFLFIFLYNFYGSNNIIHLNCLICVLVKQHMPEELLIFFFFLLFF